MGVTLVTQMALMASINGFVYGAARSDWWRGPWSFWLAMLAGIVTVVVVFAGAPVACWLALRAAHRPAAGLTGLLLLPTSWAIGAAVSVPVKAVLGPTFASRGGPGRIWAFTVVVVVLSVAVARLLAVTIWTRYPERVPAWERPSSRVPSWDQSVADRDVR